MFSFTSIFDCLLYRPANTQVGSITQQILDTYQCTSTSVCLRTSKVEKAFSMSIPCSFPLIQHATIPPLPLLWMLKLLLQSQAWTSAMLLLKMMITIAFSLYRKSWKDRRLLASITSRIVGRQYLLVKKVRNNTCVPNRDYYLHPYIVF